MVAPKEEIDGILPAATLIQNLRTSPHLKDGAKGDITRDWGHLNYGLGRYAMSLLWFCYLTGKKPSDVSFIPTLEDTTEGEIKDIQKGHACFTEITKRNLRTVRRAVEKAIKKPFKVSKVI